jgi:hypothetical protein
LLEERAEVGAGRGEVPDLDVERAAEGQGLGREGAGVRGREELEGARGLARLAGGLRGAHVNRQEEEGAGRDHRVGSRMLKRILWWAALAALVVLALNTGLVKLGIGPAAGVEADREIFARLGIGPVMLAAFGVVQILAGLSLLAQRTRQIGAMILSFTFVMATTGLFISGIVGFGFASLLFIAVSLVPMLSPEPAGKGLALRLARAV